MKKITFLMLVCILAEGYVHAQNVFPATGRTGIYTTAPAASLQVKGGVRMGTLTNYTNVDSATGNLSFLGTANYLVQNNQFAFRAATASNIGLYFNQTNSRIEFRNSAGTSVFNVGVGPSGNNVGIGTTAPGAILDVNGDALINGIKVGRGGGNISGNTVMGNQALQYNTTGGTNTAFGRYALLYNSTGYSNVAIGENALRNNTTTSNLVAVGDSALYNNGYGATASYQAIANTAIGSKTLFANTFGSYNTAVGFQALYSNDISGSNVAVGYQALKFIAGPVQGGANTAVGTIALTSLTTGYYNTAVGDWALHRTTTGTNNTGMGEDCMGYNVTGSYNTAMGLYALSGGDNNYCTALGANAGSNAVVSITNSTAIGNGATVDVSNKVRIGNTSVTSIGGQVGWTTFSDGRYKKNIKEDVKGLAFINSLKPVTYTVDVNGLNTYLDKNRVHDKKHDNTYEKMKKDLQPAADEASKIVYNGFIAQDVEAAAEKLNYNFSGVDKPKTKDGLYGLRYADFVVPLVKAVQELSTANSAKDQTIQSLQATVDKQQQQINAIVQKLNDLQTAQQACCDNAGSVQSPSSHSVTLSGIDMASLKQNVPNPFSNGTVINFVLPKQIKTAQITITDMNGQTIQQTNVSGTNSLKIVAGSLASGSYKYSLVVDGKLIGTNTMVIAK